MLRSNSHRLRTGRYSERDAFYLCTAKTVHRARIFSDLPLGRVVVQEMQRSDATLHTDTWAYVVMPDHFHWLFQLTGNESLSNVVGRVKSLSARRANELTGGCGAIWQQGFHDHCIRNDESLRAIARYVVDNPVRAGLCKLNADVPSLGCEVAVAGTLAGVAKVIEAAVGAFGHEQVQEINELFAGKRAPTRGALARDCDQVGRNETG